MSAKRAMNADLDDESVLGKFRAHLWDYRTLVAWLLGLGTLPPIVGAIGKIGPPWPDVRGIGVYTSLMLWVVLVTSYQRWQDSSLDRLTTLNGRLLVVTIVFAVAYLILNGMFVVDAPTSSNRIAKGFLLRTNQQKVLEEGKFPDGEPFPVGSEEDLLKGNQWNARKVYVPWTVGAVEVALLSCWVAGFGTLGALSSVFILSEGRRKAAREVETGNAESRGDTGGASV
ncbi:MAG: hypothetical protein AB7G28_00750 [Pirellulales bacterium]